MTKSTGHPELVRRQAVTTLALILATAAPVAAQSTAAMSAAAAPQAAALPPAAALPFGTGEELVFRASVPVFGRIGAGTMRVVGGDTVRGEAALLLEFEFGGRAGPFKLSDLTRSWVEPGTFAVRRYQKRERSPLASRNEAVEIFPAERRWTAADGSRGPMASAAPLDELAFLYFIRTLPLRAGESERFFRHYDERRNPVAVRVVGRERLRVPAGEFETVVVEMTVVDPERYGGTGTILLYLTDDERRIPVRIISTLPEAGRVRFDLESATQRGVDLVRSPTTQR